ncbi:3-hydroxyacyl-CoA dehydrogenase [Frankia casuarinae]|uniref:3-hydroxyacyl-CoA dehydrogenase n=1 Tax=Frankia casuarinae (strain DSM 45818 / CECT 9043 / HFP020203 / CcI3) TaxID=106370 RepID=Q2JEA9_FRACC|nr:MULTISPECIES: 3-hydroxybutyryl-CoA dehydrogenase [Frankia]ABD10383.1 3-hydroxyacyl-CoA dehydrogenase [Frankia casuarinae]ETA01403.1 3-hydroxyacyl-CoA dehydrogenase [Frankia sp. CcI6]EYT91650.1 3-hydroxyacyl-CoA dehydrogenase [Frankia casuarinae]KDA40512.1 3-hydroxyacyl-CoA dehydrogenase [Frankia sp. BMG5.23]ORT53157.1 3-hydroxybutyryl-CoA dehydrogenase [Frankia sp. KB5]
MDIQLNGTKVGVVGLGTMGAGIAEVMARAGIEVVGVELNDETLARGLDRIRHSTDRAMSRGKLTKVERDALLARIQAGTGIEAVADCQLVIEAIPERIEKKLGLFAELDRLCPPETIFTTNTSSLPIITLAVATSRPSRVVGTHWSNPAPVMGLVEIIHTAVTDPSVLEDVGTLVAKVGKTAVVAGDRAGFIVTALLFGYLNSAVRMLEACYATREDIDAAMRFGCGHPMGPLALLDLIGLDSAYEILDSIYHTSRDHLHAPAPLLKQLVTAGMLGRKTGRGFYTYAAPYSSEIVDMVEPPQLGFFAVPGRPVHTIGVVGTGTMASGIIEVCAHHGYKVVFRARSEKKIAAVRTKIERSLDKAVERGKISSDERTSTLARVRASTDLSVLAECDLIIEAVVEDLDVKRALFAELDTVARPGAVLATTTSSLPVIECATATSRPQDVVGMHWFNPAKKMRLVEIVPTIVTADDVTATVFDVARTAGKYPVRCADRAGFIVNTLLFPYLNDAVKMLESHYVDIDVIDTAMKVACAHPMGPFELADVIGLDVTLAIQRALYREFREPGYTPTLLLEDLVRSGCLGYKTGRGFRVY